MSTGIATNAAGFPVVTCGRCAGSGRYPSSAWNGVCLECSGPGIVFASKTVTALAAQWQREMYELSHSNPAARLQFDADGTVTRTPSPLTPGDRIRQSGEAEYRTVQAVRATARITGSGMIGPAAAQHWSSMTLLTVITFDDGTTAEAYGQEWQRDYDRAAATARQIELATQAVASYQKFLDGEPARAATRAKRAAKRAVERAAQAAVREAERAAQETAEAAAWAAVVDDHPELTDLAGARYADVDEDSFMGSMRAKFLAKSMTDKQITAAVDAVRRDRQRAAGHTALLASGVTVPTGRVTITGTVTATWTKDTDFGTAYKMRVQTAEGWTAAGTIPRSLDGTLEEMRGRTVTFTANIEPSREDRTHGWYSRPAKATWVTEAVAA